MGASMVVLCGGILREVKREKLREARARGGKRREDDRPQERGPA